MIENIMERKTENKLTVIFFFAEFGEISHWKNEEIWRNEGYFKVKGFLVWKILILIYNELILIFNSLVYLYLWYVIYTKYFE